MNKTIHRAQTRGHANHGWLDTYHTFSFAGYYDPRRIHFGALRVLNDDTVAPGEGFGTHPHDNMEIVSIALEGALRHGDSMGNMQELRPGEIQVMSAGTGITHSEMNASDTEPVKFLQIWVLTDAENHTPRYNQIRLAPAKRNELRTIVAPEGRGGENTGWLHQDAWFSTLDLDKGHDWMLYHTRLEVGGPRYLLLDRIEWNDGWPEVRGHVPARSAEAPVFE